MWFTEIIGFFLDFWDFRARYAARMTKGCKERQYGVARGGKAAW
jgi:hypothetical protein